MSIAKLTSVTEISRFTIQQINDLIGGIDTQIAANNTEISKLTTDIANLENSITKLPDGLQATFDNADFIYTSTFNEYVRVSTNYIASQDTLSTQRGQLSTLYIDRDNLWSSLQGYLKNYSSILSTYKDNKQLLDAEERAYSTLFGQYLVQSTAYVVAYNNYLNTQNQITTYTNELSSLSSAFTEANTQYNQYLNDFVQYSTITIPNAQYIATSTLSTYQHLVRTRDSLYDTVLGASTAMRLAQYQLDVANANAGYAQYLAMETQFSNYLLGLTNDYNQTTDPVQRSTLSTYIGSTNTNYRLVHESTLWYQSNLSTLMSTGFMAMIRDAEQRISSAFFAYQAAMNYEESVVSTISGLKARIDASYPLETTQRQTLSSLSSVYKGYVSTQKWYSDQLSTYTGIENVLSSQLRSTLINISTYVAISTFWGLSTTQFQSTVDGWSTIERQAQSTLDDLLAQQKSLQGQLDVLNGEITGLNTSISAEFGRLDGDAATFYSKKRIAMLAEVDEFRYAAREYNCYIGALTAELSIQKYNLFDTFDLLTFQIQSSLIANDITTKNRLEGDRNTVSGDQTKIQALVNSLNPLEVNFNALDVIFQEERRSKDDFIQQRSTIHRFERNALSSPTISTTFKTDYVGAWTTLQGYVTTANSRIAARNQGLDDISTAIGQARINGLTDIMTKYSAAFTSFPPVATFPYVRTSIPAQSVSLPMDATYALLDPIRYA